MKPGRNISSFEILTDDTGAPYLSAARPAVRSRFQFPDFVRPTDECTFLEEEIFITKKATTSFSSDLTSRDDVLLAVLSILLILAIESILTTVLLRRSHYGNISNVGFSVKQFVEQARNFRLRYIIKGPRKSAERRRNVNFKVLCLALAILTTTFGIEVVILFLTDPHFVRVTNKTASLRLVEVISPDWNAVRSNFAAPFDRQCSDVVFRGVTIGVTRVTLCLPVNTSVFEVGPFQEASEKRNVTITSDLHAFGAQHLVSIGNTSASLTARAYYKLGKGGEVILSQRTRKLDRTNHVLFMHKQFAAFLLSLYARQRNESLPDLDALNKIMFKFDVESGPVVDIISLHGKRLGRARQAVSVRHTTSFKAALPSGNEAFRVAQIVFKASTGIVVSPPDVHDLGMQKGNTVGRERIVWREQARTLNWLSMILLLSSALVLLYVLRASMNPVATSEIAGVLVRPTVGAGQRVSPTLLSESESGSFSVAAIFRRYTADDNSRSGMSEEESSDGRSSKLEVASR